MNTSGMCEGKCDHLSPITLTEIPAYVAHLLDNLHQQHFRNLHEEDNSSTEKSFMPWDWLLCFQMA